MDKKLIINIWSKYKIYLKIIITLLLFYFIIARIDFKQTFQYFKEINFYILIPLGLYPLGIYISTLKWKISLNSSIKTWELYKIYWISNFFSNFLPSTIGGDSYKLLVLKKHGLRNVFKSIVLDRGSGIFVLIILLGIFGINIGILTDKIIFVYLSILMIFSFLMGICVFILISEKVPFLYKYKQIILDNRKKIYSLLLLSGFYLGLGSLAFWTYFLMFGLSINLYYLVLIYLTLQLLSMIPISLNGWGLREFGFIYLTGLLGVSPVIAIAIALISRFAGLFASGIGGVIYLFDK